jgi:hypothetical protein
MGEFYLKSPKSFKSFKSFKSLKSLKGLEMSSEKLGLKAVALNIHEQYQK